MSGLTPHRWHPNRPPWRDPLEGAGEQPTTNPNVTEGARRDKVLYGPKGEELVRIVDRPFRGYRREA